MNTRGEIRQRSGSALLALVLVSLYATFLFATNDRVTVFEDEATIVFFAGQQEPRQVVELFLAGTGQHQHPPLYDILLHYWIRFGGDSTPALLRAPSIVFFGLALWLVGETAQLLWGKRLWALLVGIGWPAGYFLGRPAHWSAFAMLLIAAMTHAYYLWRRSGHVAHLCAFTGAATALIYTNYLGAAFVGMLGLHLLATRPTARALRQAAVASAALLLAALPLALVFARVLAARAGNPRSLVHLLADGGFHAFSLFSSEAVAPWTWPAALVVIGIAALILASLRARESWGNLGMLAAVFAAATLAGALNGRYLGLFGPWLWLSLTGVLVSTPRRGLALAALLLISATGWLGIASGRWPATYRYTEPWPEITATVLALAKPGDLIVCGHPSFYFYAHYQLGWHGWEDHPPAPRVRRSGRSFAWHEGATPIPSDEHVIFIDTIAMNLETGRNFERLLASAYRLVGRERYVEDRASALKSRFVPNQRQWRIEVKEYRRVSAPRTDRH